MRRRIVRKRSYDRRALINDLSVDARDQERNWHFEGLRDLRDVLERWISLSSLDSAQVIRV